MSRETKSRHVTRYYTPLFDSLIEKYDLLTAAVYGRAWRFCQMEDGVCYATVARIAEEVGVSYDTALRRLKDLCAEGYLEDLDPGLRNHPHRYRLTGKLDLVHVSETVATEPPSSCREQDEPIDQHSSCREQEHSSCREQEHSSCSQQDEATIRNNKKQQQQRDADAATSFSEQERQALGALRGIGFPESDAIGYAQEHPALAILWSEYATAQEGLRNPGGFVRRRLDAGDPPPQEPSRGAPPPPPGTVYT